MIEEELMENVPNCSLARSLAFGVLFVMDRDHGQRMQLVRSGRVGIIIQTCVVLAGERKLCARSTRPHTNSGIQLHFTARFSFFRWWTDFFSSLGRFVLVLKMVSLMLVYTLLTPSPFRAFLPAGGFLFIAFLYVCGL